MILFAKINYVVVIMLIHEICITLILINHIFALDMNIDNIAEHESPHSNFGTVSETQYGDHSKDTWTCVINWRRKPIAISAIKRKMTIYAPHIQSAGLSSILG